MGAVRAVGIDVGMQAHHVVVVTGPGPGPGAPTPAVTEAHVIVLGRTGSLDELDAVCAHADAVGIDAPERQTDGCSLHAGTRGRCAEVALAANAHGLAARLLGGPVGMLTPPRHAPFPARLDWMHTGFELWRRLGASCPGVPILETYPSGSFRRLAAGVSPPVRLVPRGRRTAAVQRLALVAGMVELPPGAAVWGLDGVDALAAALAVYRMITGSGAVMAQHDHPGHDGSRIVLLA